MRINAIIIDDFLDNPDVVRNSALALDFYETGTFPGLRSDRADTDYELYIQQKLEQVLNCKIKEWVQDSFRFQLCTTTDSTWVHKDTSEWAAVLYLTPCAPLEAGTGLYIGDESNWMLETAIGNVYNRLALYRGTLPHQSILPGFGNSKDTARLTQVFFFNTYS
jgi:hypothetical protein